MNTSIAVTDCASISIADVCSASPDTWDKIWRECDYATYFHSREWAEIWSNHTQGKIFPKPKLVTFSDGKTALIPLSARKLYWGLVTDYISSVEGGFGGWISTDQLQLEHAALLVDYLTARNRINLVWRLNPYDELVFKAQPPSVWDDETHAINLEKDFKAIYTNQSSAVRKARKAEKSGVTISVEDSLEGWKEYYEVYQETIKRWGDSTISVYDWSLFQEIFQCNSPHIKLWVARYQGKIVSGALCFYAKKHSVYWHGSSLESYFQLRPVNLLMYEIMKDAHSRGYTWFDFNPSAGLKGVAAFKVSLGASPLPSPIVSIKTPMKEFIQKVEYRLTKH